MAHGQRHLRVPALERCGSSMLRSALTALVAIALALPAAVAAEGMLDLPPRPDPPPFLPPTPIPSPAPRHSAGAHIRLLVAPEVVGAAAPSGIWTVVQWEDEEGVWHDVGGWCGHLDDARAGAKTWWVSAADYGRGPFRWAVLHGEDGPMLAVSAPFDLPSKTGQVLEVDVALP